jgi:hypothetical protein
MMLFTNMKAKCRILDHLELLIELVKATHHSSVFLGKHNRHHIKPFGRVRAVDVELSLLEDEDREHLQRASRMRGDPIELRMIHNREKSSNQRFDNTGMDTMDTYN